MLSELLLLSGNDIPFPQAQLTIHQPTLKEIALLGEDTFYTGCEFLRFSKDNLNEEDKIRLNEQTNFEVIMSILKEQNVTIQKIRTCVVLLLAILFPEHEIKLEDTAIKLIHVQTQNECFITSENYDAFIDIINQMFCLKQSGGTDFNPSGDMAKRIADKLRKRQQILAEEKGPKKVAILSRYVSILAVGQQKDMNGLMQYTVFQLFDEFRRYELKISNDLHFQARMAGAKDLKEVEDWMKDIHSESI